MTICHPWSVAEEGSEGRILHPPSETIPTSTRRYVPAGALLTTKSSSPLRALQGSWGYTERRRDSPAPGFRRVASPRPGLSAKVAFARVPDHFVPRCRHQHPDGIRSNCFGAPGCTWPTPTAMFSKFRTRGTHRRPETKNQLWWASQGSGFWFSIPRVRKVRCEGGPSRRCTQSAAHQMDTRPLGPSAPHRSQGSTRPPHAPSPSRTLGYPAPNGPRPRPFRAPLPTELVAAVTIYSPGAHGPVAA